MAWRAEKPYIHTMFSAQEETLISALTTATRGERVAWPTVGRLLHEAETQGTWKGAAENFTAWMREVAAPACGLKETSVWRYLRAFRIYERLRADFAARGTELPPPEQLQAPVGPESLELLDKLTRAAPRNVTDPVVRRLLAGTVERKEIRTLWYDYRPALLGRTAQGRGVRPPKVDARSPQAEVSLTKAHVLSLLRRGGAAWAGASEADRYAVFPTVELPAVSVAPGQKRPIVDALVLVLPKSGSRPEFHGILVCANATQEHELDGLMALAPYFTRLWVVSASHVGPSCGSPPKQPYGVLRVDGGRLVVEVEPSHQVPEAGTKTGDLAIEVLMDVVATKG